MIATASEAALVVGLCGMLGHLPHLALIFRLIF